MQPVDLTTVVAICAELRANWLPARLEQVIQIDRYTLFLALRTIDRRGWLRVSWHPQAARLCISAPPPRLPDTFTFSQQLRHQIGNLALSAIVLVAPWERAIDLQFARRPGEPALWHLYVEIMGQYSNVILANQENVVITAAHQVTAQQSSLRPILTGQPYEKPPAPTNAMPSLEESHERWRERLSLVPGSLRRNLLKAYRGLSSTLTLELIQAVGLDPNQSTAELSDRDWQALFQQWQTWLIILNKAQFQPGWTATGYTVLGWQPHHPADSVGQLVDRYYLDHQYQQEFAQLHHQLTQKLNHLLEKLHLKANTFRSRLQQSDHADQYRNQADLLMAHLHQWQPGMTRMDLPDFATGEPVTISLNPEKNAVQNAQSYYKQHQKLKRARNAVEPLLTEVLAEAAYLEQVEAAVVELDCYQTLEDLGALQEIRDELIQQGYLEDTSYRRSHPSPQDSASQPHRYRTPSGLEVLVGRNNRQNDHLTFRMATDYDLWFHTQEIPGSHVLLRLEPGTTPEVSDLQFAADLAAYYSRARQTELAPVIYTQPRHVYKPKGAKPGMSVYKHETVLWGKPQQALKLIKSQLEVVLDHKQ